MGIFNNEKKTLEKIKKDIYYSNYEYSSEIYNYDFQKVLNKIQDEELLCDILEKISLTDENFQTILPFIINMYSSICVNRNKSEERKILLNLVDLFLKNQEIFTKNDNFIKVVNSFDDKRIVFELFSYITTNDKIINCYNEDNISIVIDYLVKAREFFVDDRAFYTSFISLINNIDDSVFKYSSLDVEEDVEKKIEEDKKSNGIYDIDKYTLAEMSEKLSELKNLDKSIRTLIESAKQSKEDIENSILKIDIAIKDGRDSALRELSKKSGEIIKSFNDDYLKLLNGQKKSIYDEKDELLASIRTELESRRGELLSYADDIERIAKIQLGRVNSATDGSVRKLEEFVENSEKIKSIINNAKTDEDFLNKLTEISDLISQKGIEVEPKQSLNSSTQIIVPNIITNIEKEIDYTINYYFNESIPFNERYEKILKLKEAAEKNGEIFHERFDDIVKLIIQGQTPYIHGPSGCGKTYMIQSQLAKLLNIDVLACGYILYEQDVIGYTNSATGGYVPNNFYNSYKYGKTIFLDELDNGIASATVVLNRFIGSNEESYTFPDGISTKKHPNFRIITSGNTKGEGRTVAYNTRQKMDESVLQRLTPIEVNYDNRIEKLILKDYPDWYNFAINFRKAIELIPNGGEEKNTMGTFTTRDAQSVKKYLDNNSFTTEKILEFEFIQTKDIDLLNKLSQRMKELVEGNEFTTGGKKLLKTFNSLIKEKSE